MKKFFLILAANFSMCSAKLCSQTATDSLYSDSIQPPEPITGQLSPFISKFDGEGNFYEAGGLWGSVRFIDFNGRMYDTILQSCGKTDVYLEKFDPSAGFQWIYHACGEGMDIVIDLIVDSLQNVYVVGYFTSSIMFDRFYLTDYGDDKKDIFIAKFGPSGNLIWAQKIIGKGDDVPTRICILGDGNICVVGTCEDKVQCGNAAAKKTKTSDTFIAIFEPSGGVQSLELLAK